MTTRRSVPRRTRALSTIQTHFKDATQTLIGRRLARDFVSAATLAVNISLDEAAEALEELDAEFPPMDGLHTTARFGEATCLGPKDCVEFAKVKNWDRLYKALHQFSVTLLEHDLRDAGAQTDLTLRTLPARRQRLLNRSTDGFTSLAYLNVILRGSQFEWALLYKECRDEPDIWRATAELLEAGDPLQTGILWLWADLLGVPRPCLGHSIP